MSYPIHMIPPDQLWKYRQAIEDSYAEEARRLMDEIGTQPVSRRGVKTNDLTALPGYPRASDPDVVRQEEVKAVASRLVEKLRDKDARNDSI